MSDDNKETGKRLREAREFLLKIQTKEDLAEFLKIAGITQEQLKNYESGRTAVPSPLLVLLYELGINPTYILTGEGTKFAGNPSGMIVKAATLGEIDKSQDIKLLKLNPALTSEDSKFRILRAVAGNISKLIEQNE